MLEQCQCSPGRLLGAILPTADGGGCFHTNKLGELLARDPETISQRGDVNCSVCHGYQIVHFALLSQVPNALAQKALWRMTETARHDRLRIARETAGYAGPGDASAAMGVKKFTYTQHENGHRNFPTGSAIRYANFFRVNLEWLVAGKGPMKSTVRVPIVGYVGAGAEVYPEDAYPLGQGSDFIDAAPDGISECVAVSIKGDSMHPLGDGWLIVYTRNQDGVPESCVNKLCVVKLHDGPTLLKTLQRGRGSKLWTLESWNAPIRENVRLDWAARVIDIRPR